MNANKAREFFSSYFEGTIDAGLRQAFERRLNADAELQAEYRAFERTMGMLNSMKDIEVEVPFDLNERINARIDRHVFEQKRQQRVPALAWWKSLAFGGVAALAIFGTIKGFGGSGGDTSQANLLGTATNEQIQVTQAKGQLTLKYQTAGRATVVIRDGVGGQVLRSVDLDGQPLESPLINSDDHARVMSVEASGSGAPLLVAVPGVQPERATSGEGDLTELVRQLAGHYRVPVVLVTKNPTKRLNWSYESLEAVGGATEALADDSFAVELRSDGVLWIQEH
ncbi:MAG TPA: hypothetical protein VM328_12530 [Fimbriimonadaceae bacterium]|nr:hypothetical protein [Fimbriimonadaceae bacterium]